MISLLRLVPATFFEENVSSGRKAQIALSLPLPPGRFVLVYAYRVEA